MGRVVGPDARDCKTGAERIASRDFFERRPDGAAQSLGVQMFPIPAVLFQALIPAAVAAPEGIMGWLASGQAQIILYGGLMLGFLYFTGIRPQQRRAKEHATKVSSIKRGDTVVLTSGLIGKVVRVEEQELGVEIAQNVTVKVVKSMISEVRTRGEPAPANDPKS
jgi:preprotein translocase subunit YajC